MSNRMIQKLTYFLMLLFMAGCVTQPAVKTENYSQQKPQLLMQSYFDGNIIGYGIVLNKNKKMTRRFKRTIKGIWKNDYGFIREQMNYTDGIQVNREWCIHLIDQNHFVGVSTDVSGLISGEQYGNAIHLKYRPSTDIDIQDKLHTADEAIIRFRQSSFENVYSLLVGHGVYSAVKAAATLQRENINPSLNHRVSSYTEKDIGEFCQRIQQKWAQKPDARHHLFGEEWLYAIDSNNVIEMISIQQNNLELGEVIENLQKSH
jgi:hypothetical protein